MKRSLVAEFLMNALVKCPPTGFANRAKFAAVSRLRNTLAKRYNWLARYRLEGTNLLLPLAHQLPIYRRAFGEYSTNVGRLAECIGSKYPGAPIIDVGANIGDTIAIIRAKTDAPILAIEGDDFYFSLLKENLERSNLGEVTLVNAFVGSDPCMQGTLHRSGGTASFVGSSSSSIAPIQLEAILAQHPRFETAKLLKIDTDGFDCQIVKSSLTWIVDARPIVFIEFDPTLTMQQGVRAISVFWDLRSAGYKYAIFWKNTGEYLLTAELRNTSLLEDLDAHCSVPGSYLDIAFLHEEDSDLASSIRRCELGYFRRSRTTQ